MCVQAGGASPAVAAKVAKAKVNIQLASQRKSNVANKVQRSGITLLCSVVWMILSVCHHGIRRSDLEHLSALPPGAYVLDPLNDI